MMQALQALGIVNEHTVLAGASAGAIVAAALACNIAAAELLSGPHGVLLVFEECRWAPASTRPTCATLRQQGDAAMTRLAAAGC
jgi:predicted acylesterase/phospholipase RssA